jgi:hypothetical protein
LVKYRNRNDNRKSVQDRKLSETGPVIITVTAVRTSRRIYEAPSRGFRHQFSFLPSLILALSLPAYYSALAARVFVRKRACRKSGKIARRKQTERWARMAGRKNKATQSGSFVLQKVAAIIPTSAEDLRVLETYLEVMGCSGLLGAPWAFESEALAAELIGVPAAQYLGRIRAHPERWTEEIWRTTYGFREGDVRIAERNDELLKGEFLRMADPKDGYVLANLKDPDARLVMGFLNPIFHPEKPKRVVAKLASLFLGAMRGKHQVDWAALMKEQVDRMVINLPKGRKTATPVSTYVGHLYAQAGELMAEEQEEYEKLLSIQSYGGQETESDTEESDGESQPTPVFTRKRSRSVQGAPDPEQAGPSRGQEGTATQTTAASGSESALPEDSGAGSGPMPDPVMSGHLAVDIVELADHIIRRTKIQYAQLLERDSLIAAIMGEAKATGVEDLFNRFKDMKKKDVLLQQMENRQAQLNQTNANLREQVERLEGALREAGLQMAQAQEKANASGLALAEVQTALSFPADTVNRALLFTENLERDEKLNRGQIIRFLLDHSKKMEKTWSRMQELIRNMFPPPPIAAGTQTPEAPSATPVSDAGTSQDTPASFNDMVGTPDFETQSSWSALSLPNSEALRKWQHAMPEGWSPVSPPTFRIPSESPSPDQRRRSLPDPRPTDMEISPSVSLRDLPEVTEPATASAAVASGPEPSSSRKDKEPESTPEPSARGKKVVTATPRRRSPRKKS